MILEFRVPDQSKYTDASAMRRKFGDREPNLVSFLAATTDKDWRNRQEWGQLRQDAFSKGGGGWGEGRVGEGGGGSLGAREGAGRLR